MASSGLDVADVVGALVAPHPADEVRIVDFGPRAATLLLSSGRILRVLQVPLEMADFVDLVDRCLDNNPKQGSDLILVGGRRSNVEQLREAMPTRTKKFSATILVDGERPQTFGAGTDLVRALDEARVLTSRELEELERRVIDDRRKELEESHDRAQFFEGLKGQVPRATYGILAAIVAMFILQELWVPSLFAGRKQIEFEVVSTLLMGAMNGEALFGGHWWRALSAGFLHAGLVHIGMNGFILYVIGGQLERVIGSSRFLVLYVVSLIAGSVASGLFVTKGLQPGVGASGAIWGLLGAQYALAYRRPPVLPESIAQRIRPMAKNNLLLNGGISLAAIFGGNSWIGSIDWAAHFGGGLGGGLLMASGVLYGFPDKNASSDKALKFPSGLLVAATLSVALMGAAVAQGLLWGEPWSAKQQFENWRYGKPSKNIDELVRLADD